MTQFKGKEATVDFCGKLCIGTGECGRAAGDLVVGGRQPWIVPDEAEQLDVKDVIERCPSGALSAQLKGGEAPETAPPINTIHVTQNGPYFVRGDLEIDGAPSDAPATSFRAALCRCGKSKNKPFCDSSHIEADFKDSGAVGRKGDAEFSTGGALKVERQPNASLLVGGNLTIHAGTGREAWHGTKVSLCRCGASKNKPFCDGSHLGIGFEAP